MHLLSIKHLIGPLALINGLSLMACAPLNSDIEQDLSTDPKACINGVSYLPFTNGTQQKFTAEGNPIPCVSKP